jgi:O-antigen ligase
VGTALMFQRATGTEISAHAVQRSRTFVDYQSDIAVVSRLLGYGEALEAIQDRPILGSGQGSTVTSYTFDVATKQFERWIAWTLDSLYLTLWMKMGLPGLIAFVYLCGKLVSLSSYILKYSEDPRLKAFGASSITILAAFLVLGLSDGTMVNGRFTLLFGMLFGCVAVVARAVERQQPSALAGEAA